MLITQQGCVVLGGPFIELNLNLSRIFSPLNVMNRFTLKQHWDLLKEMSQQLTNILVSTLMSKITAFGAQKFHMWSDVR